MRIAIATLTTLILMGCSPNQRDTAGPLTIAAAADLKYAIDEVVRQYQPSHGGIDIKRVYGSSGSFYAQIGNNAPFDVFLSADMDYPRKLQSAGLAIPGTEFQYAVGRLVIWTKTNSPIDVQRGMQALLDSSVQKISIANPQHAPYGRAAVSAMQHFGIYNDIKTKFVFAENVAQALEFIDAGAAQIGIIAMSLAAAPTVKPRGKYWEIPLDSYPRMDQGGIILKRVRDRAAADDFRAFLTDAQGRAILKEFGFFLPEHSN